MSQEDSMMQPCRKGCGELVHLENDGFHVCKTKETKRFHIGDVLSAYSGFLVSNRHMAGVYDTLNFLTGDNLYTHALPRAMDECHGWLERMHPILKEIDCSGLNPQTLPAWLDGIVAKYGETLELRPLPDEGHEFREPTEELESMVDKDRIVKVSI
jgi:hypothetical protein